MIKSFSFRAMNTLVLLAAEGEGATAGIQAAKLFIDECEQRFSRFLPASELSELNRSTGSWVQISNDLMDMLQLSMKYHQETFGIFDPAILADLKRAGYDRSMDEIRAAGMTHTSYASSRTSRPAFREMSCDLADNRVYLPRGMEIDLGGIAKAWIIEKAAELLHSYADVCAVSAGGDILFVGHPLNDSDWDVFLEDPRDPTQMLAQLHVPTGAVATSSVMKRRWQQGEQVRHHLIDPRTGEPANTDWLSVTVLSPDILTAEVYAKALLIGGKEETPRLLQTKPDLTFIAVDANGNLVGSSNYKEYIYELSTDSVLSASLVH